MMSFLLIITLIEIVSTARLFQILFFAIVQQGMKFIIVIKFKFKWPKLSILR